MKKFKTIISSLQETAQSFGGSVFNGFSDPAPRSAFSEKGIHYAYDNPEQLHRLNAFIYSFLGGSYIDPREPLKELAGRIAQLGLSMRFDNNVRLIPGHNVIPVGVFGDKFGVTPTTDLTKEPFDTGADYPDMFLHFELAQTDRGYVFNQVQISSEGCTDCPGEVGQEEDNTISSDTSLNDITNKSQDTEAYNIQNSRVPDHLVARQAFGQNLLDSMKEDLDLLDEEAFLIEKREIKDSARVVELFLSKSSDASKTILGPIYASLQSMKKRNKYTSESALSRFSFAVNGALRSLKKIGKNVVLTDLERTRVTKRLLHNFEKHVKTIED